MLRHDHLGSEFHPVLAGSAAVPEQVTRIAESFLTRHAANLLSSVDQ
jgi:hypothetical protein